MRRVAIKTIEKIGLEIILALIVFGIIFWFGFSGGVKYLPFLNTHVVIVKAETVGLKDSVTIEFSNSVFPESVSNSLSVYPSENVNYAWSNNNKKLEIKPENNWNSDTEYFLDIKNGKNIFGFKFASSFSFETEDYPHIYSMVPIDGEKDVVLDIEDPISINFDKSINNYDLKFVVKPNVDFSYQLNEKGDNIKLIPSENFKKETRYELEIYIKYKNAPINDYQEIYRSSFTTKPESVQLWSSDSDIKLVQAKKYTPARILEGKYIDINLKNQVMTIFENGKPLDSFLISSGKRGMDTPDGSFKIYNKTPRAWSKEFGLYMPYWMAILPSGKVGIHELPEWPSGYKEGTNHLGIPVSHGCVRLGIGPAKKVYEWAEIGTSVIIHY